MDEIELHAGHVRQCFVNGKVMHRNHAGRIGTFKIDGCTAVATMAFDDVLLLELLDSTFDGQKIDTIFPGQMLHRRKPPILLKFPRNDPTEKLLRNFRIFGLWRHGEAPLDE